MAIICNLLLCTILAAIITNSIAVDYCNIQSCKPNRQTMCKYNNNLGPSCVNAKDRGLRDDEKTRIVNKHNELRQRVASGKEKRGNPGPQPGATYMPNFTWDYELEMVAQKWADQCTLGHDECRNVARFPVGQNVAMTMNTAENNSPVEGMVEMWYNEVDKMDKREVEKLTGKNIPEIGHYTQLVWANSTKMGCGRIKFREGSWNKQLLVCNYAPAGNYIGQKVYQIKK